MKRQEKAEELSYKYFPNERNICARDNVEAVKTMAACLEISNFIIDKVYEWLEENLARETTIIASGSISINFENAIRQFKKEMLQWQKLLLLKTIYYFFNNIFKNKMFYKNYKILLYENK